MHKDEAEEHWGLGTPFLSWNQCPGSSRRRLHLWEHRPAGDQLWEPGSSSLAAALKATTGEQAGLGSLRTQCLSHKADLALHEEALYEAVLPPHPGGGTILPQKMLSYPRGCCPTSGSDVFYPRGGSRTPPFALLVVITVTEFRGPKGSRCLVSSNETKLWFCRASAENGTSICNCPILDLVCIFVWEQKVPFVQFYYTKCSKPKTLPLWKPGWAGRVLKKHRVKFSSRETVNCQTTSSSHRGAGA